MKKLILILLAAISIIACNHGTQKGDANKTEKISLTSAGATFPLPFYNMVFKKYTEDKGVLLTYGGIGSGGGITSLKDKVVDFGATDAYLEDDKMKEMPAEIVHIPTCIGAVVIAYNLPGIEVLKLSDGNLEKIFLGEIKKWDHPEIIVSNPGVKLPNMEIAVVYRSDGSGTTSIFSDYMSKISSKWESSIGRGKSLNWPVGMGAKGNPGVAGMIKQTPGAIGYIGSEYAFSEKITFAKVKNSSGNYIEPTIESITASAQGNIPTDTRVMLTNSSDPAAYPISGFTWIILYKEQAYENRSAKRAEETVTFLNWLIGKDAQSIAPQVNYAPLPEKVVQEAKAILQSITYGGQPVINN